MFYLSGGKKNMGSISSDCGMFLGEIMHAKTSLDYWVLGNLGVALLGLVMHGGIGHFSKYRFLGSQIFKKN